MFSINRPQASVLRRADGLYIPLCFLLIAYSDRMHPKWQETLHSTMFSINLLATRTTGEMLLPLHSTMFSINPILVIPIYLIATLYIPLCFLLIFFVPPLIALKIYLYIPLSFLLIAARYASYNLSTLLYIPLCFLLINRYRQRAARRIAFTFHYVFY